MGEQERYDVLNVLDFTRYVHRFYVKAIILKCNQKLCLDCYFMGFHDQIWNLTKLSATGKN